MKNYNISLSEEQIKNLTIILDRVPLKGIIENKFFYGLLEAIENAVEIKKTASNIPKIVKEPIE